MEDSIGTRRVNRLTSFGVCGCLLHSLLFLYSRNLLTLSKFWNSLVWVLLDKIDSAKQGNDK